MITQSKNYTKAPIDTVQEILQLLLNTGWKIEFIEPHFSKTPPRKFLSYWSTLTRNGEAIYIEIGNIDYVLPDYVEGD